MLQIPDTVFSISNLKDGAAGKLGSLNHRELLLFRVDNAELDGPTLHVVASSSLLLPSLGTGMGFARGGSFKYLKG